MKKLLQGLLSVFKRSQAPPDDLDELLAERRRLDNISQWARTEQWQLCFRAGYWAAKCGLTEAEAWEKSVVKAIQEAKRKELAKPIEWLEP